MLLIILSQLPLVPIILQSVILLYQIYDFKRARSDYERYYNEIREYYH